MLALLLRSKVSSARWHVRRTMHSPDSWLCLVMAGYDTSYTITLGRAGCRREGREVEQGDPTGAAGPRPNQPKR
jgi:hypothetical protein